MNMKKTLILLLTLAILLGTGSSALAYGAEHEHVYDPEAGNGICTVCGSYCRHPVWLDGVCQTCGARCQHPSWQDGRCTLCRMLCPHEEHGVSSMRCTVCGEFVPHTYENGVCVMCGEGPWFQSEQLPAYLFAPSAHKGSIQTLSYQTHNYALEMAGEHPASYTKQMCVYLPYGYDATKPYDVLVLMHGMGGGENYWLVNEQVYFDPPAAKVKTTDLIENMVDLGTAREMIIVTPTFYINSNDMNAYNRYREQDQFVMELRNDILPLVVEKFSTYAAEPTCEAISAVREHFAYAGLSMGSIYGYNAVMPLCLDLFAWFGEFSGAECWTDLVIRALNSSNYKEYPILWFYNAAGTGDNMFPNHQQQYQTLVQQCPGLTDGVNASFTKVTGVFHEYKAWGTGLYNFLLVLFADHK